jgi:hypothetical protein
MLGKKIIAAVDGGDDFAVVPQRLLQGAARADGTVFERRSYVGFFLAADLGEELIQIMDDAEFPIHVIIPVRKDISRAKTLISQRKNVFGHS